ncbi:MAG TPA: hypothetical protein VFE50_18920 [Cyclobacteriaceae bacterium]|nr:hypothetical protein [Cyclobacteriaceae bacterium]
MRTRLFLAILFFLTFSALAQVSQTRYEMPLHDGQTDPYQSVSLGENGLFLYATFIAEGQYAIEVIRLDTTFTEKWRGYIKIERNLLLYYSIYLNDRVFMLLKDRHNPLAEFQVLSIYIENGNYSVRTVKTMLPFVPTNFAVTPKAVLIGGTFNYRPLVLYYNFEQDKSKILPGFFNEAGELDQMRTDEQGNIDVVVSGKNISKRRSLWIRHYDPDGDLLKTIVLQPDEDKNLIYGRSITQPGGYQVVCGVYGRYTEYSRGIFIASIDPYGEYSIRYYNFGDLQKFFNYMKARREQRVKDRIERRKIRGKKLRFNYRVLVSDLLPYGNGQFLMLGEAFYPHYSYPTTRTMGMTSVYSPRYGNVLVPGGRGDLVFDGFQYTHAVVVGFDNSGSLRWDNSFEINDVRTYQLQQFVKVLPQDNRIALLYLYDNVIRSKIIKDADVIEGKSFDNLSTAFKEDVVKERGTSQTKLEYWYDDVFYATGIQQITNSREPGVTLNRKVFFINRIEYK